MIYKLKKLVRAVHSVFVAPPYKWELAEGKQDASQNTLIQIKDTRIPADKPIATIWYPGQLTKNSAAALANHLISIIDGDLPRNPEIPKNKYGIRPLYQDPKAEEKEYAVRCNDSDLFRLTFSRSSSPDWEPLVHERSRVIAGVFLGHLPENAIQLHQPVNPTPVSPPPHL